MNYIGIDLGTTNSAIASFDGQDVTLYKSPEQQDVTPSAIYINSKRGQRFVGSRAYDQSSRTPDSVATLFKRFMGTRTPVQIPDAGITMTPEEASAEILRTLFTYLPEEMRRSDDIGTVITVPAAFNQMQKDATLEAASMAEIGSIALMQEPVAAVMSIMQESKFDGSFLVYDLGGGTLDIAIAESIAGRISLLSHGGVAMLGGRDFDRSLYDGVTKPWLYEHFNLPPNILAENQKYRLLARMAMWATEKAKIGLSQREQQVISLSEDELRLEDLDGKEIYLDIPVSRAQLDRLIEPRIVDSLQSAREAIESTGYSPHDIERIVFVGGPTQYAPLRERISFELGITSGTTVNPMTAVATGAAIFAESIDWSSENRGRKQTRGSMQTKLSLSFNFTARTPTAQASISAVIDGSISPSAEVQFDSQTTGWSSGRLRLQQGAIYNLPLPQMGEHVFKVSVFGQSSTDVTLSSETIIVTRTAATVDAIPASHTISIEAKEKAGGRTTLVELVKKGDPLPKLGSLNFFAESQILPGSDDMLNFKLREGDIEYPLTDNEFIGKFAISGSDLTDIPITSGAEIRLDYEVLDSGTIQLYAHIPSVGATFPSSKNLYSRQDGQIDETNSQAQILGELRSLECRVAQAESMVSDHRLDKAREKLETVAAQRASTADSESNKQSRERLKEAKSLLYLVSRDNRPEIQKMELDAAIERFNLHAREYATPSEEASFDNLTRSATRVVETNPDRADDYIDELENTSARILWRQNWYVQDLFEAQISQSWAFPDRETFTELEREGSSALQRGDFNRLRGVVYQLYQNRYPSTTDREMAAVANIVVS